MSLKAKQETRTVHLAGDTYQLSVMHYPFYRGVYEKGGGQISPDEPESYEILKAKCNGVDIDPSEELQDSLVTLLFEQDYAP